jgi:predicted small lipoprotein YifL
VILIVKSSLALIIAAAALLAGCGQPGPLYMPKPPAKRSTEPVQPKAIPDIPPASQLPPVQQ